MTPSGKDLWSPTGVFARYLPGYESRESQQRMYEAVLHAISRNQHLIVEAGTGTGKSLAYLTPAILATHRNPNVRVVVSTATINLQEQLVRNDIPAVVKALEQAGLLPPGQFTWSTIKGKGNYLCREQRIAFAQQHDDGPWRAATSLLQKLDNWQTSTGDRAELRLGPEDNWPWSLMSASQSNTCSLYRSGHPDCFLHQARQRAQTAHIVVTNHALLLSDIAAHEPYLGHITHVIIDEAHHLEEEASRQFGWELNEGYLRRHLSELESDPTLAAVVADMTKAWNDLWQNAADCRPVPDDDPKRRDGDSMVPVTPRLRRTSEWRKFTAASQKLADAGAVLGSALNAETKTAVQTGHTPRETTLRPVIEALSETLKRIADIAGEHDPAMIQWLQPRDDHDSVICAMPLQVGPILQEKLFDRRKSVILTSATLATEADDFSLFVEQTGFPGRDRMALPSPFDYTRQARLMSPVDMPNPRQFRDFGGATADALINLATRLDGHTLALFTSNAAVKDAAFRMRKLLHQHDITVLAQGIDGAPADIISRFRANPRAIILGVNSFWEGVDLSEDLLHAVAICRLPFPVPSDPVIDARSRLFGNAFEDYQVPLAILRFRQGFGRLVRNHRSKGSVVILDPRIRHPRYGMQFFRSLPKCDYAKADIENVGDLARQWLDTRPDAGGQAHDSEELENKTGK